MTTRYRKDPKRVAAAEKAADTRREKKREREIAYYRERVAEAREEDPEPFRRAEEAMAALKALGFTDARVYRPMYTVVPEAVLLTLDEVERLLAKLAAKEA